MNINIDVNIYCVNMCFLHMHNKYTQNTHIYYANNFYFILDVINRLTALNVYVYIYVYIYICIHDCWQ